MRDGTKRILIVEHDRDLLANLSEIFEDRGFVVLAASTEDAALIHVRSTRIGLAIIGLGPRLRTGAAERSQLLRAFARLQSNRPLILRGAFAEDVARARRSYPGPTIGLVDPFDTGRLCEAVEQAAALAAPNGAGSAPTGALHLLTYALDPPLGRLRG